MSLEGLMLGGLFVESYLGRSAWLEDDRLVCWIILNALTGEVVNCFLQLQAKRSTYCPAAT